MNTRHHRTARRETPAIGATGADLPRGLRLTPFDDPRRATPRLIGVHHHPGRQGGHGGRVEWIGQLPGDGRFHWHVQGVTGAGKSTWLTRLVVGEAAAGRGVALLDPQGDLVQGVLDRLPLSCARRVIVIDPAETLAPAGLNPLDPGLPEDTPAWIRDQAREWAAESVAGVFSTLHQRSWGPRMDDILRGACHTLVRRPGTTLLDVTPLLTDTGYRRALLAQVGPPAGFETLWASFDELSASRRDALVSPVVSRIRALAARRSARDLLGGHSINLTQVLDGGILLARLPKGELGDYAARLLGALLLACLWSHTTRRASRAPADRPDASIVVDEAHNFVHLPSGLDDALAESRGFGVGWVLAHQNLDQLTSPIRTAVSANARNKGFFTVGADDAVALARHVAPWLDAHDLAARPAYSLTARLVHQGQDQPPVTLDTLALPPPIPGRAELMRAAARRNAGLGPTARRHNSGAARMSPVTIDPAAERARAEPSAPYAPRTARAADGTWSR